LYKHAEVLGLGRLLIRHRYSQVVHDVTLICESCIHLAGGLHRLGGDGLPQLHDLKVIVLPRSQHLPSVARSLFEDVGFEASLHVLHAAAVDAGVLQVLEWLVRLPDYEGSPVYI